MREKREIEKLVNQAIKEVFPDKVKDYPVYTKFLGETKNFSIYRLGVYRVEVEDAGFNSDEMYDVSKRIGELVGFKPACNTGRYIYWLDNDAFQMSLKYDVRDYGKDSTRAISLLQNKENLIGKEMIVEPPTSYLVEVDDQVQKLAVKGRLIDISPYQECAAEDMVRFKFIPIEDNVHIEDVYYGDSSEHFFISKYPFEELKFQIIEHDNKLKKDIEAKLNMETFHLTSFVSAVTGLPNRVWVATYAPGVSEGLIQDPDKPYVIYEHDGRYVKVLITPEIEVVEGDLDEQQFSYLKKWIERNMETLLSHWKGEIDSVELANKIDEIYISKISGSVL